MVRLIGRYAEMVSDEYVINEDYDANMLAADVSVLFVYCEII